MNDDLDTVLDRAVRSYAAEPRFGLDVRMIAGVHGRLERRRRLFVLGVVSSLAACAVLALVFLQPKRHDDARPVPHEVAAHRLAPSASATSVTRSPGNHGFVGTIVHRRVRKQQPWRPMFPTPEPLTPEELALLRGAGQPSKEHNEALRLLGEQAPERLEIDEITIQPLDGGEK